MTTEAEQELPLADTAEPLGSPSDPAGASNHDRNPRFTPLHVIAALVSALALWSAAAPIRDLDSFWHAQLGEQIARLHRVTELPSWWLGVPEPSGWVTSQWLSELGLHGVTADGWRGLMFLNLALMVGLLAGLALTLLRGRIAAIAVPVFIVTLAGSSGGIQQRPQSVSLVILPWLGLACARLLKENRKPPLAVVAAVSLFWAQCHGLWILGPVSFTLVAAGVVLDDPRPIRHAISSARPALLCLAASMAGVLNPQGLTSFILPFRFRAATFSISEWWPTTFASSFTVFWGALLLLTFVAWARSTNPVPRSELLWVCAWTVFGTQSFRNVSPALLLIAPVAITALTRTFGERLARRPASTGPRESRVLAGFGVVLVCGAALLGLVRAITIDPFADTPPARIAAWVAAQPGPVRIMNSWNSTAPLVGLSDGKARLVVDGRADLWGATYAKRLADAESMRPGWETTVEGLHPQAVVTEKDDALVSGLQSNGWRIEMTDDGFVLLLPGPDARFT